MHQPNRPPVHVPYKPDAAPHLTKDNCCSACRVKAELAGDGDMKVCPQCYALLWHQDFSEEAKRRRDEERRAAALRELEKKARRQEIINERIKMRKLAEEMIKNRDGNN